MVQTAPAGLHLHRPISKLLHVTGFKIIVLLPCSAQLFCEAELCQSLIPPSWFPAATCTLSTGLLLGSGQSQKPTELAQAGRGLKLVIQKGTFLVGI